MPTKRSVALLLSTCSLLSAPLRAAEKITYDDHIFPIFESSCLNCHNPDKKKGDLDLSNYTGTMAGGSGGLIANAGDGASSKIYTSVTHTAEPFMPPKGDKIAKKDADLIRTWIDGGLLENTSSRAKKSTGPKIAKLKVDPSAKPDGPPPMPEHLNLEPVITSLRNTTVNDMACSPWAPLLAITAQKQILLFNTDTLQLAAILPFPKGFPETVSFHPTGKYLIAGGGIAGKSGTTYTWDVTTGKMVMANGREFDSVLAASLRLDLGGVALGGPSRLIKLWDPQSGEELKSIKKHTDWITSLAYSPDGVLLATGDRNGGAWIWEAGTGNEFHTLKGHTSGITKIAWRADSNLVATSSEDGQVIFWEMNNGKQVKKFTAHSGGTLSFDYARSGEFVTSGRNREVKIWNPDFNLKKVLPKFGEMVVEVAITQDGKRLFTADWNGKIEAWDANTFARLGELPGNPPRIAERVAALQKQIADAPKSVAAAKEAFEAAQAAMNSATAALQKNTTESSATSTLITKLQAEKTKLDQETTRSADARNKLLATRDAKLAELKQAQGRVSNHRDLIAKAETEVKTLDLAPDTAEEKKLIAQAKKMRDQSNANPEDAPLKQQAEIAEKTLTDHRTKLAQIRSNLAGAQSRLSELKNQLGAIVSNVGAAQKGSDQANTQLKALDANLKKVGARRAALGPETQTANERLAALKASLKPAQDTLAAKTKAHALPKAAFEKAQADASQLQVDLKFWRAAEVNAQALVVTEQRDALKAQQDSDTEVFNTISQQLAGFLDEVKKIDSRKGELTAQLAQLGQEIGELRTALDERKPQLEKAEAETKTLQGRYQEFLK